MNACVMLVVAASACHYMPPKAPGVDAEVRVEEAADLAPLALATYLPPLPLASASESSVFENEIPIGFSDVSAEMGRNYVELTDGCDTVDTACEPESKCIFMRCYNTWKPRCGDAWKSQCDRTWKPQCDRTWKPKYRRTAVSKYCSTA